MFRTRQPGSICQSGVLFAPRCSRPVLGRKFGAPGPHASVRYLIPKDDWLVVLTFDTPSPRWAIPLVEAFDEIAIRATWAR